MYKAFISFLLAFIIIVGFTYPANNDKPPAYVQLLHSAMKYFYNGNFEYANIELENALSSDSLLDDSLREFIRMTMQMIQSLMENRKKIIEAYHEGKDPKYIQGLLDALITQYPKNFSIDKDREINKILKDISAKVKNLKKRKTAYANMSYIEGGVLDYNDGNIRKIYQVQSFYLDKTEVSNQQYCDFLNSANIDLSEAKRYIVLDTDYCKIKYNNGKYEVDAQYANKPVIVTWYGAEAYAKWAEKRLPTWQEWLYAARGGSNHLNLSEQEIAEIGVFGSAYLADVKSKKPNDLGLYNIYGNVAEWTANGPENKPNFKYICGGWYSVDVEMFRNFIMYLPINAKRFYTGFRCAKD